MVTTDTTGSGGTAGTSGSESESRITTLFWMLSNFCGGIAAANAQAIVV